MPVSGSFTLAALTISVLSTGTLLFGLYQPSLYACRVPSSVAASSSSSVQMVVSSSTNATNSTSDVTNTNTTALLPSGSILFTVMNHDNISEAANSSSSSVSNCECDDSRLCFASTFLHYSTLLDIILAFSTVLLIALLPWTTKFGAGGASIAIGLLCVLGGGFSLAGGLLIYFDFRRSRTVKFLTRAGYTCGPEAGTYAIIAAGCGLLFVLAMFLVRGLGLLCLRGRARSAERRRQEAKKLSDGNHARVASVTVTSESTTTTTAAATSPQFILSPPFDDSGVGGGDGEISSAVSGPRSNRDDSPLSWRSSDQQQPPLDSTKSNASQQDSDSKEEEHTPVTPSPPPPPPPSPVPVPVPIVRVWLDTHSAPPPGPLSREQLRLSSPLTPIPTSLPSFPFLLPHWVPSRNSSSHL